MKTVKNYLSSIFASPKAAKLFLMVWFCLFLSGCALGHSAWWKEEVLLHDGQTIIVDRALKRGGRHEITQPSSITEHTLRFTPPGSRKSILWKSEFDPTIGYSTLDLMALDMDNGTPYIVAQPAGCLSYNKWGRPNPPYIFFKYSEGQWQQIPLQEFPSEIRQPNVVLDLESNERFVMKEQQQSGFVSVQKQKKLNEPFKEPCYRSIIRTPLKPGSAGVSCPILIRIKDGWVNLPQFNGHFKEYTQTWYTVKEKGVFDAREAGGIQQGV